MGHYRILVERTGKEYVRVTLQHKFKLLWRTRRREYLSEGGSEFNAKLSALLSYYCSCYGLTGADVIDTRVSYAGMSLLGAYINECKLLLEGYIWRKRMRRLRQVAVEMHMQSGVSKHTRKKYWVMTDSYGNPMLMTSNLKNLYKAKGWYSKAVDAKALDAECIFSTDNLYDC